MIMLLIKLVLHLSPVLTYFATESIVWALVNALFIVLLYIKVQKIEAKLREITVKDRVGLKRNLRFWRRLTF